MTGALRHCIAGLGFAALGFAALGFAALGFAEPAGAATVVKMATLAPDGSIWDQVLRDMGAEWEKETGGAVSLRIYAGGVAGDEPDVVRKLRIGQLHGAALSTAGLIAIDKSFEIFEIPMFFDSYPELFYALDALRPALEERLRAKGFVMLHWVHGGWVHLFSKQPIVTVDDLRAQKLFVWAGNDNLVKLWRQNRFQPVPLAATDILTGLQTGMIETLPTTPLAALSLQWFRQTPYMQDLGLAPLVGAMLISEKVWKKISEADRAKIMASAAAADLRLKNEIPNQDRRAVSEMQERGLEVVSLPPANVAEWQAIAETFTQNRRASMEAKDLLDQLRAARDRFRIQQSAAGSAP